MVRIGAGAGYIPDDPQFINADRIRCMGALGQQKTEQRQPHADENDLTIRNFPRGSRHHQLSRGVGGRRFNFVVHFGSIFFAGSQAF